MPQHVRLGIRALASSFFQATAITKLGTTPRSCRLARLGCELVEIDIEPFYETARLLYEGPWVAERTIAAHAILSSDPDAIHPGDTRDRC